MSYLIRDAFSFLFFMGVGVNDLVPQRTQSHVGSLDRNRGGLEFLKGCINACACVFQADPETCVVGNISAETYTTKQYLGMK